MFKDTTLAYAAGILDGEGHFSITWDRPRDRYLGMVGVMNTNRDLLDWLQNTFGGSIYHRKSPSNKSHWKERYEWRAGNTSIDTMLPPIVPYLIIKKRHAKIMIDFRLTMTASSHLPRPGLPINPAIRAKRKRLRERLLVLNDSHRAYVDLGSGLSTREVP